MRRTPFILFSCLLLSTPSTLWAAPEDAVVKVFATVRYPNPLKPWTNGNPVDVLGSGAIIEGNRIVTNAHLVLYASDVQIQPRRGGSKIEAKIEAVAADMDLAILSVMDAKFFEKHPPLVRAKKLPKVQDNVAVYGFPVGGNDLSVTKGVVSRIGFGDGHLVVQVSAAVNPGNSGGPALVGEQMVGLVFGRLREGENIGFILPNEEIDFFLGEVKAGRSRGKVADRSGTEFQRLENKSLRGFLKLDEGTRGVLVTPPRRRPVGYPFEEFDVLTKIGPHEIDNEGMVQLPDDLRIAFHSVLAKSAKDGAVPVTLIRKGQRIERSLPVSNVDNLLLRSYRGEKPAYFIHGPLVFSPAKADAVAWYLQARPDLRTVGSPLLTRYNERIRFADEELVVVTSPMFAHPIAKGYDDPIGQVVQSVNGTSIKNLAHLVEVLRDSTDEYLKLRFAEQMSEVLVFNRVAMDKATEEVLEDNGISPTRRGSEAMLRVWKQHK
jgi:hypothetical protein